jgi:enamine deaminase RidA (YjgF/YER057c/UK114 family)
MSRIDERLSQLGLRFELWGDPGRHARSAIGVAELPFDIPVEIEAIVQL